MLSYVNLKNFKCFDEQDFALGNLTLIAGANGASFDAVKAEWHGQAHIAE